MPRLELDFLPRNGDPTDQQLLLQLVCGLCKSVSNPREERSPSFYSVEGIPLPYVRRLVKVLVQRLELPIPPERVDEWVDWHRTNHAWVVDQAMADKVERLMSLTTPDVP